MKKQTRKIKLQTLLLLALLTLSSAAVLITSAGAQGTATMQSWPFIGAVPINGIGYYKSRGVFETVNCPSGLARVIPCHQVVADGGCRILPDINCASIITRTVLYELVVTYGGETIHPAVDSPTHIIGAALNESVPDYDRCTKVVAGDAAARSCSAIPDYLIVFDMG